MPKFIGYEDRDDVVHHLEKRPELWWKIRTPTSGDDLAMTKFVNKPRFELDVLGNKLTVELTMIEIAYREIALLFAGTNIPEGDTPVEDGGEPFIKTGASIEDVEKGLKRLPMPLVMELWRAIKKAAPSWGPSTTPEADEF